MSEIMLLNFQELLVPFEQKKFYEINSFLHFDMFLTSFYCQSKGNLQNIILINMCMKVKEIRVLAEKKKKHL